MTRWTMIIYKVPEERAAFDSWIQDWRPDLDYVSNNEGCGCCADIYRFSGPKEARLAVPDKLLCGLNEGW